MQQGRTRRDKGGREKRMNINGRQVLGVTHKTCNICRDLVCVVGSDEGDNKLCRNMLERLV